MTDNPTLIDAIELEMACDDADRSMQSEYLRTAYEESEDRASIDRFLIALCGWSFETLDRRIRT